MKTIKVEDIRTGDVLFNCGKTWLAKQIQTSQKEKGNILWYLNHAGVFIYQGLILCVGEEDYPGRFDMSVFKKQYIDTNSNVYLGRIVNRDLSPSQQLKLQEELLEEASKNKLTNYGYLDILSFKINSLCFKWFHKEVWIGRKENKRDRYTCSQRTAKYIQDYYNLLTEKNYLEFTPADIADESCIEVYKIIY
ncbi:MAG: hypothetical protein PHC93_05935 [Candidatus Omnitrophica bacterium]|nr:hypothetical protein [Candidatus Omnitrophota bacterium]